MDIFNESNDYMSYHTIRHCEQEQKFSGDFQEEIVDTAVKDEVKEEILVVEICELLSIEENDESSKEKSEAKKRRKSLNKIRSLLVELLDTERTYVKDLEEICRYYLPLSRNEGNFLARGSHSLDRKKIKKEMKERRSLQENLDVCLEISTKDARVMLANIEELKDYHKKVVLVKMEHASDDASLLRELFTDEVSKMEVKYGRYCINKAKSAEIVNDNWEFLSLFQEDLGLSQRIDAQLIKPVQRLTRYHMFLSSLAEAESVVGDTAAKEDYRVAQAAVLEAANHTNTLMWVGQCTNSHLDLSRQGNLLKHGPVKVLTNTGMSSSLGLAVWNMCKQSQDCQLFLFQQTLLICKVLADTLVYKWHVNVNKVIVEKEQRGTCFHLIKKIYLGNEAELNRKKERRMAIVQCSGEVEKEEWVQAIHAEISLLDTFTTLLLHPTHKL